MTKLLVIGEAWGEQEEMTRQAFVGESGKELWRMLGEGIGEEKEAHSQASQAFKYGPGWHKARGQWMEKLEIKFTNVFPLRPTGNDIKYLCEEKKENKNVEPRWQVARGQYLRSEYQHFIPELYLAISRANPNLILALGNTACWAVLGATNIGSIRGNVAESNNELSRLCNRPVKVLPTYHPAAVLRNWSYRPIVLADIIKAWRQAQFPEIRRPERWVLVNPTLEEISNWISETKSINPPWLSVDIETAKGQITCIGFGRSRSNAMVIPIVDWELPGASYWNLQDERVVWGKIKELLELFPAKIFQNGIYDLQYILRMSIRPVAAGHDTMLLHHSHYPELQKGLGFLGSVYTDEASWKLMRKGMEESWKRDE